MSGKTDYRTAVLEYLRKNTGRDISRDTLIAKTGISKSRLTEVLQSIRDDGYNIVTPPRSRLVRLESAESTDVFSPIKDSDIRQWFILFLLSVYGELTFKGLLLKLMFLRDDSLDSMDILRDADTGSASYTDNSLIQAIRQNISDDYIDVAQDVVSVTALRKDLEELRKRKLIRLRQNGHTYYELTNAAPYIIPASEDELYEFFQHFEESASSTSDSAPIKQVCSRIQKLINLDSDNIDKHRFGKINNVSNMQIETFNSFIVHSYNTNLISFDTYERGSIKTITFATGLLFYSVETASFYILGRNLTADRIESHRMDRIKNIQTFSEENKEFHSRIYYGIYQEMFSSHYEDKSYKVKVLFQDFANVKKRFSDLNAIRQGSSIRPIVNPPEGCDYNYVYEDTIRGLGDFSRYLRSFGSSVLAVEPPELKDKMLYTYNRIVSRYTEVENELTEK